MPKSSTNEALTISALPSTATLGESDTLPVTNFTTAGDPVTQGASLSVIRQALQFDFAYTSPELGLEAAVEGETFFVFTDTNKQWVLQYQKVSGIATPVLGYDNAQIKLPTSRRLIQASKLLETGADSLLPMAQGGVLSNFVKYTTLERWGADPTGTLDSTAAVLAAFQSGLPVIQTAPGTYLMNSTISLSAQDLIFKGAGMGKTVFVLNHYANGFMIGGQADSGNRYSHHLSHFSIARPNYANYSGTIGPKSLYISNSKNGTVEYVDESGAIGYGIQFDYSDTKIQVSNCYVHDHFGGNSIVGGTDGIHFYRTKNFTAFNNRVVNVGDDAISMGSFLIGYPVQDGIIANNHVYNTQGGFKVYSYAEKVIFTGNIVDGTAQGGVYLTNDANALAGSYIRNITIDGNQFYNIAPSDETNIEAGALRIRGWTGLDATWDNITFQNNIINSTYAGISLQPGNDTQRLSNFYVRNNSFRNQVVGSTNTRSWIRLPHCDAIFVLDNNDFDESCGGAVSMDYQVSTTYNNAVSKRGRYRWTNNRGANWNKGVTVGRSAMRFFWIRSDIYDLHIHLSNNVALNQYRTAASTDGRFVEINRVHPDSFCGGNEGDGGLYFQANNGGFLGPDRPIPDLTATPGPQAGTHQKGAILRTDTPSSTRYNEYRIVTSGTLDTIGGTITTAAGSRNVTIVSQSGLYEGAYISIAGVTGTKRLVNYLPTAGTGQLDTVADTTVTAATIANVVPTYLSRSYVS